jgi:predicted TIM-barrel fold metal-dependent hydrolase
MTRYLQHYPFHKNAAYKPDVSKMPEDPLGAYLQRMEHEGIHRAVLVHPEPYGDDHRLILECLGRKREQLKGTCLLYPRDPDAPREMEEFAEFQNFAECIAARKEGKEMRLKMDIDIATDLVNVIYTACISAFEEDSKEMLIMR